MSSRETLSDFTLFGFLADFWAGEMIVFADKDLFAL